MKLKIIQLLAYQFVLFLVTMVFLTLPCNVINIKKYLWNKNVVCYALLCAWASGVCVHLC